MRDLTYDRSVWQDDTPYLLEDIIGLNDVTGVVMLVENKGKNFTEEELDVASDMFGFEGIDLLPQPVLVFFPDSLNLIYNEQETFERYSNEVIEAFPKASRVELFWPERSDSSALVCKPRNLM